MSISFFDDPDKVPLYLDLDKKIKIDIKIEKENTCEEILLKNNQKIQNNITDNSIILNSKNDYDDYKIYFVIINNNYLTTRLKLKPNDKPRKYLETKNNNLYFIPIKNKNNKSDIKLQFNTNKNLNDKKPKPKVIYYVRPEDCIREGQLNKYDFRNKKFEMRKVNIDKYKIIMSYSNDSNLWKVIYLHDIKTIIKGTKEQQIKNIDDLFEITLSDNETYIFKANNAIDREEWFKVINSFVVQIKENNYLVSLSMLNNNFLKEMYKKQINIIFNNLSLKGVLSLEKTRNVYYSFLKNFILQHLIENIIKYKIYINKNDYEQSFVSFKGIMDFLDIKTFNLDKYNENKKDIKKISKNLEPQENKEITKEFILKNMNSLKTLNLYIQILKGLEDIFIKENQNNKNRIKIEKFKKYLKSNTLSELFDNIIYSIHRNFHSKILKNPEFLYTIKMAIIYYLKPKNFSINVDFLNLKS